MTATQRWRHWRTLSRGDRIADGAAVFSAVCIMVAVAASVAQIMAGESAPWGQLLLVLLSAVLLGFSTLLRNIRMKTQRVLAEMEEGSALVETLASSLREAVADHQANGHTSPGPNGTTSGPSYPPGFDPVRKFQLAMLELNEIERVLASALGYPRYGDVDPDPPGNPDDYVIGDQDALGLAYEAARKLKEIRR